ncbi:hypothetical protein [Aurantibacter sp.]|uniref:hypothetical protein n=1 Tax=Aurantibacter sp. TaxID=2807103 RepID=UPI00326390BF
MNTPIKSIFNLIEIFRKGKKAPLKSINVEVHCDQMYHHDFYCDGEKSFLQF